MLLLLALCVRLLLLHAAADGLWLWEAAHCRCMVCIASLLSYKDDWALELNNSQHDVVLLSCGLLQRDVARLGAKGQREREEGKDSRIYVALWPQKQVVERLDWLGWILILSQGVAQEGGFCRLCVIKQSTPLTARPSHY